MNLRNPAPLPPYRALLAVDMADFSGYPGRDHQVLTDAIPDILRSAFAAAGLADAWTDRSFGRSLGDGYAAGFPPSVLPFLLNPLLSELQEELQRRANEEPASPTRPIRMRVSINVGPVEESSLGVDGDSGGGRARIELHRLLDAQPVRNLLTRSTDATRVAAIVSERVVQDAVQPGYSGENVGDYVPAPVAVKTFTGGAYLRVPYPTGDLLHNGFLSDEDKTAGEANQPAEGSDARAGFIRGSVYGPAQFSSGTQVNDLRNAYRWGGRSEP